MVLRTARQAMDPATVQRVMLIRPRYLGDVCLTLPVLDAVRAACPDARIAFVVERDSAPLLEGDARVDELIVAPPRPSAGETLGLFGRLRAFAPQVTLDLFCNPRTALWTFASGAPVRVGYARKGWRSALYTHHAEHRMLSSIDFHLASPVALGWPAPWSLPRLRVSDAARTEARAALDGLEVPRDAALLGLHPGARYPVRRWAADRFVALAQEFLDAEPRGMALVSGGAHEGAVVRAVAGALPPHRVREVVGWPLARFVALQSMCAAFVSNDTGPAHSAVATGCPTLGLISRNRPAVFFPYPAPHRAHYAHVECSPCHRLECDDLRCLERLDVPGAWSLLRLMLAERNAMPAR
jgi:ADP-heptose:LPS heptosyltransferase